MRNLSVHNALSEEDALNLLFIGDTNRVVSETPKHDASTRSHCMFIITISARSLNDDLVKSAKIHIVDLAGSENITKMGYEYNKKEDQKLLGEALNINISLFYLESVIVALRESSNGGRTHIPYRNSMLTSILRDSLGGNCKTTMIANISFDKVDVTESISTLRFSQNVASIKNNYRINEEQDPSLIIKRLRKEIDTLKNEIRLLKGGNDRGPLSLEEKEYVKNQVEL